MTTELRPIEGYEGYYSVTRDGRIYSDQSKKFLKLYNNRSTEPCHLCVDLYVNQTKVRVLVHRVVAKAFKRNRRNRPRVSHINGDRKDNRVENLEWRD